MKILPIVRLGHPALRKKSTRVAKRELATKKFQTFLDQLAATCVAAHGAGIAAPQVGINKRIIVVNVDPANPRYPGRRKFPLSIVINPVVESRSKRQVEDWEGDLSASIAGRVPRSHSCVVTGLNRDGGKVRFELSGFAARVFQHEIDHLDGVFLIDRVKRLETLMEVG